MSHLRSAGFRSTDISVLFPENQGTKDFLHEKNSKAPEGVATGGVAGGVMGGVLGWLTGIGALTIPAPRLGLADAIVDLVSTGSTLVMNGLRPIGDVLDSEAVLVTNPEALRARSYEIGAIDTMLSAVIAARGKKDLMMNAPAAKLPELEDLLPGLESPSVIPLAHAGMIAIHSVVDADAVWGLLPKLKAAGASGILVLPIEKIVP